MFLFKIKYYDLIHVRVHIHDHVHVRARAGGFVHRKFYNICIPDFFTNTLPSGM